MKRLKTALKEEIGELAWNNYFQKASLVRQEDKIIYAGTNMFVQGFVLSQYKKVIEKLAEQIFKQKLSLEGARAASSAVASRVDIKSAQKRKANPIVNTTLNFDNFIVGDSNSYAYSVCKQICDPNKFGKLFNPIFIYSNTGLGKTHLLHACGKDCLALGKQIVLKTSTTFKNDYQAAVSANNVAGFLKEFEDCELLLIDDVQFLANTQNVQQDFFHIFNEIVARGGQVVMTSDVAPKDLEGITERLKSRFANGIIANITPPDIETKQAILQKKCELHELTLDKKVLDLCVSYVGKNVRDIEGLLNSMSAYQTYTGRKISYEDAKKLISEYIQDQKKAIEIEDIFQAVSDELSVKVSELQSASKSRKAVRARRVVIFMARELLCGQVGQIADSLKMKTHSNVSHHLKVIDKLLLEDSEFAQLCESIKSKLLSKN